MAKGSAGSRSAGKGRAASKGGGGGGGGGGAASATPTDMDGRTDAEVTAWQRESFDKAIDALPSEQRMALSDYGGNVAENLNRYIRNGQQDHPLVRDFARQYMGPIDKAIASGRTPEAVTVYRRVESLPTAPRAGDRLVDPAYMSTSLKGGWLRDAPATSVRRGDNPILMRIDVPKGTPVMSMHRQGIAREHELLFGRNTAVRVARVERSTDSRGRPITIVHGTME